LSRAASQLRHLVNTADSSIRGRDGMSDDRAPKMMKKKIDRTSEFPATN